MSKFFASLLDIPEPLSHAMCQKMEHLSGYPSEDVRLQSEIEQGTLSKIAQLGLDSKDTTGQELYNSLLNRLAADSTEFAIKIGDNRADNIDKRLERIVSLIKGADTPKEVWALKTSVSKELLRKHPPRRTMKLLNYRSVDSLLKRGDVAEIYSALPYVESSTWLGAFWRTQEKVTGRDFEKQPLKVLAMDSKRWGAILPKAGLVNISFQTGAVAVWPSPAVAKTTAFNLCVALAEEIDELFLRNNTLKLQQIRPKFGQLAVRTWTQAAPLAALVGSQPLSWRSLQRHYGKLPAMDHPMLFEPHVEPQDFRWQNSRGILADLNPLFGWWNSNNYLSFMHKGRVTSLNLADTVANSLASKNYKKIGRRAAGQAAWDELVSRYLKHPGVESYILNQLDRALGSGESISLNIMDEVLPSHQKLAAEALVI